MKRDGLVLGLSLVALGCGRGLDRRPGLTPADAAREQGDAPADVREPADAAALDAAGPDAAERADTPAPIEAGPDASPVIVLDPVPPLPLPVVKTPNGELCGAIGLGGIQALVSARAAPVASIAYGDGQVLVLASDSAAILRHLVPHPSGVTAMAISEDGATLAIADGKSGIDLVSVSDGQLARNIALPGGSATQLAFADDGKSLAAVVYTDSVRTLRLWRTGDGSVVWTQPNPGGELLAFLPTGELADAAFESVISFHDLADGKVGRQITLPNRTRALAPSADGRALVGLTPSFDAPGRPSLIGLWSIYGNDPPLWDRPAAILGQPRVAVSPQGLLAWFPFAGGPIHFLRVSDGDEVGAWDWPRTRLAAFDHGGASLIAADGGGTVRVVDAPAGRPRVVLPVPAGPESYVGQLFYAPDGQRYATRELGGNPGVEVWRASDGARLYARPLTNVNYVPAADGNQLVAFSPDSTQLVFAEPDGTKIHLVSAADGHELRAPSVPALSVGFSPDGASVVAGVAQGGTAGLRRFRVADGVEQTGLGPSDRDVAAFAFSPDGTTVVTHPGPTGQELIRLWRVKDGTLLWQHDAGLEQSVGAGVSVVFSPDGRWIAAGASAGVDVVDAHDGHLVQTIASFTGPHSPLSFSRDSAVLAFAGETAIELHRTADWSKLASLPTTDEALAFSPTEDRLVSAGYQQIIRTWCNIRAP
jgi:WD40 repeat protein